MSNDPGSRSDSPDWPERLSQESAVKIRSLVLAGILFLMVMYTLYLAASLFIPIVLAILLSLVFSPIVRGLARLRVPKMLGALLVLVTIIGVLVSALYGLVEPVSKWLDEAPRELRQLEYELAWVKKPMEDAKQASEQVEDMTEIEDESGDSEQQTNSSSTSVSLVNAVQNQTPSALFGLAITLILLFFLLASGDSFLAKMVEATPKLEDKKRVVQTARDIQHHISLFLGTITVINLAVGVVVALALYLLEVPNPILWGLMVGILNYIPYLGVAISIVVVTFVSLLTFEAPVQILLPGLVIFGVNVVEGQVLTPLITGRRLALSPVAVFLSLVVLGWMWGLIGVLMAVPILVCTKLICERIETLRFVATFLSHTHR